MGSGFEFRVWNQGLGIEVGFSFAFGFGFKVWSLDFNSRLWFGFGCRVWVWDRVCAPYLFLSTLVCVVLAGFFKSFSGKTLSFH